MSTSFNQMSKLGVKLEDTWLCSQATQRSTLCTCIPWQQTCCSSLPAFWNWDLQPGVGRLRLQGHWDQIFVLAWIPNGQQGFPIGHCLQGWTHVRLQALEWPKAPSEGPGPEGARGVRIVWVCDGYSLLISGFGSQHECQLLLDSAKALTSGCLAVLGLDVAPSILSIHDLDTGLVLLTDQGDTCVFLYKLLPESSLFLECNSF